MKNDYFKINIPRTDEQIALAKELGSRDKTKSMGAAEAIAAAVNRPLLQIIEQAPVFSNMFHVYGINPDEAPKLPLDLYFDVRQRNFLHVFVQNMPGGTSTSFVQGNSEQYFSLMKLVGQASMNKNYARASNLQVIAKTLERLAQEVLIKQNINATNVLMNAVANSRIDGNSANTAVTNLQVVRTATQGVFQLDDFNTLMTKYRRIVSSWVGGTPIGVRASLSDMCGSPEWMGQLRSMAYQPQNTRAGSLDTNGATALAAPDSVRESIFNAAGIPSMFGVDFHEFNELGVGQPFNQVFANYAGNTQYVGYGGGSAAAFVPSTEQVVIGLNRSMFDLVKMRRSTEAGEWTVAADDTFTVRSDKIGWYGEIEEGYASLDNRGHLAIIL